MDVNGTVEGVKVAVADGIEELFAGLDAAARGGEADEQIKLDGGERERFVIEQGDAGAGTHAQRADDNFLGRVRCGGLALGGAAGDGAKAGEQFARRKCFGQIIVRADFEADDAVRLLAAAGEHEDRRVRGAAEFFEDLEAIHAREHDIEDDGVGSFAEGEFEAVGAGVGQGNVVAHRHEIFADEAAELAVVIDDEDAGAAGRFSLGCHDCCKPRAGGTGGNGTIR